MAGGKPRKALWKRWWFWVGAIIIIIIIATVSNGGGNSGNGSGNNGGSSNPIGNSTSNVSGLLSNSTNSGSAGNTTAPSSNSATSSNTSEPAFEVKVTGSNGVQFSGAIDVVSTDGSSNEESVSGAVPKTYPIKSAAEISAVFQNQGATGSLGIQIYHNGKLIKSGSTSAQYGTVSVSTPLY